MTPRSALQREGYASAITHPEVLGAIAQGFEQRSAVAYGERGEASSQEVVVPWTMVDGPESAAAFADALLQAPRRAFGPNAIGQRARRSACADRGQRFRWLSQGHHFSGDAPTASAACPRRRRAARRSRPRS